MMYIYIYLAGKINKKCSIVYFLVSNFINDITIFLISFMDNIDDNERSVDLLIYFKIYYNT